MKAKELLTVVVLALLTTWAVQWVINYFSAPAAQEEVQAGQTFIAPKEKLELKARNTEIDFMDVPRSQEEKLTTIETQGAKLTFSTDGATLERLEFKQISAGAPSLATIRSVNPLEREKRCFMVGFSEKTPYYYELIDHQVHSDQPHTIHTLTYQASFDNGLIQKKYTIYHETYSIMLDVSLEFKTPVNNNFDIRIFFPSPLVPEIQQDVISAIASNEKGSIVKTPMDKLNIEEGRFAPALFGSEDKYFVHAMIQDQQNFVGRSYYTFFENKILYSILEGPTLTTKDELKKNWNLNFYFGPKELSAFNAIKLVNSKLDQTLDYSGWFAPISKFLLNILNKLYSFFKNYGVAIIIMSILVKLVLLPFTFRAEESMKKRAEFDRKLKYIQSRYKDNPEQLAYERAELIKKHGMPGLGGCLPLLLQLPIFISLSRVLSGSIELYRAPFLWIPDLSAKDPYYILAILIALSMAIQAATMQTNDPKQRVSTLVMALVVGAVSTTFASGLALYILVFTILGIIQPMVIKLFKRA